MPRRLLKLLTALSLLLCAVFSAAWVYAWWQTRALLASYGRPGGVIHIHDTYFVGTSWGVPLWVLIALTAALPTYWGLRFVHRWRAHRRRPGVCRRCGYDLRATPARCPECGTPAPASASRERT